MQLARPVYAPDPRRFGRARFRLLGEEAASVSVSDDLKLFAATFAAAFITVSVLIA